MKSEVHNYNLVDFLKFFFAILVIGIHTSPFRSIFFLDAGFGIITRLAVPIFFTYSGYFLFKKKIDSQILFKYIKKIIKLYLLWSLIYTPFIIENNNFSNHIIKIFIGTGVDHLWFFYSLIIGILITYFLKKFFNPDYILIIALLFYLIGLIFSTYYSLFANLNYFIDIKKYLIDYIGTRNGIFYAFPFVALGLYISKNLNQRFFLSSSSIKLNIGFFIIFIILFLIETFIGMFVIKTNSTILWLGMFPLTFSIVTLSLLIKLKDQNFYYFLRKMSIFIYPSHMLFVFLFKQLGYNEFLLFLFSTISSISFSIFIIFCSNKQKLKFLKYLI